VVSEGAADEAVNIVIKNFFKKNPPFDKLIGLYIATDKCSDRTYGELSRGLGGALQEGNNRILIFINYLIIVRSRKIYMLLKKL
jgi:hypothetical protein